MRVTYCDRCGKETESPIRTLCKKCWTELKEELLYPKTPYLTNADRIRSMTDEELASFLYEFCDCPCLGVKFCERCTRCEDAVLMKLKDEYDRFFFDEWLKQESEGEQWQI